MKSCFKVGLYWQGIAHDLSKYSPTEFGVGCKYYQGDRSPNNAEREANGCSLAWLHHKGRNKHHMEYWIDYGLTGIKNQQSSGHGRDDAMVGMKMPIRYVVEMFFDRVAASKNYQKEKYTDKSSLEYYEHGKQFHIMHPDTTKLLEILLHMLAQKGEEETFRFIKDELLKGKVSYEKNALNAFDSEEINYAK